MIIRKGKISDLKKLMKFLNETPELSEGIEKETYTKRWVSSCLTDKKMSIVLIAEDKGEIVGFWIAEMWKEREYSFTSDIFVIPEYRTQGVATKLKEEYEKICKKEGIKKILVLALTSNEKMHKFMEKNNYERGSQFYLYDKRLK